MNDYRQLPRKGPAGPKLIQDKFPKAFPMYWGPNQRILEDDVYVEPSGFVHNRLLVVPKVVRFIHDAHEENAEQQTSCTFEPGWLFPVPSGIPVFSVSFRRVIGTTFAGNRWWIDGTIQDSQQIPPGHPDELARGIGQYVNAITGELIVVQPDIIVRNEDIPLFQPGYTEIRNFQEAFDAGHTEINSYSLVWRWFSEGSVVSIGQTYRSSPYGMPTWPGQQLLSEVETDPICPDDYYVGCPCLP